MVLICKNVDNVLKSRSAHITVKADHINDIFNNNRTLNIGTIKMAVSSHTKNHHF